METSLACKTELQMETSLAWKTEMHLVRMRAIHLETSSNTQRRDNEGMSILTRFIFILFS